MGQGFDLIKAERDWIVTTPGLYCYQITPDGRARSDLDYLSQKQKNWQNLKTQVVYQEPTARYRIGRRYENHLQALFKADGSLLAQNIEVKDERGATTGELDFLLKEESDHGTRFVHWESSVKFYLAFRSRCLWPDLIGPNARDNLYRKLHKSLRSQSLKGFNGDGHRALTAYLPSNAKISVAYSVMQGHFFYFKDAALSNKYSFGVNRKAPSGWWTFTHLLNLDPHRKYCIWPKRYWLAQAELPADLSEYGLVQTKAEAEDYIHEYFRYQSRALMVLELKAAGDGYQEAGRGFIVHPDWPYFAA